MSNAKRKPGYYRVKWVDDGKADIIWLNEKSQHFVLYCGVFIEGKSFVVTDPTPIDPNPPASDELNNQLKSSEIF